MNTHYLKLVRKLFDNSMVPERTNRHNRRAWVKSVRELDDKWLLKGNVVRKAGSL
jgi:hypothetical protein